MEYRHVRERRFEHWYLRSLQNNVDAQEKLENLWSEVDDWNTSQEIIQKNEYIFNNNKPN